jgi:HSP20 family protein
MANREERKRDDEIDDIFSIFDEEFNQMRERMDRMMGQMMTGGFGRAGETKVYGVSMRTGPDGRPHVEEFGNLRPPIPAQETGTATREPLVDVIEEKDKVRAIVELPGVRTEDIEVETDGRCLEIAVDSEHRKFSKRIELPRPVRPGTAAIGYKNGVLVVTMDREPPKRRKKRTIVP